MRLHAIVKPRFCELLVAAVELAEVSVVVAQHLHVEHFRVGRHRCVRNQSLLEQVDHILAKLIKFELNLLSVPVDQVKVLAAFVFFLVLDRTDCAPGSSPRAY